MLIDGEKWACEACVRGHRVTTCKHHDRPLIHINRKGRPFATCSVCNCTPCEAPEDHAKLKREADARCQASKVEPFPDVQHQHCKPPRPKHILQRQPKKSHSPS
ncbi:putative Cu-dependent DNA-binding protein, partial [Aspergillus aculeatinus CBS 121060]